MSQSAESVQDTADLDSRVDAMLREADAAAESGPVLRQRAEAEDEDGGAGDDGVGAAAEDAAGRRGEPEFQDAASVLGDSDEPAEGSVAGIEALDAMLAERAADAAAGEGGSGVEGAGKASEAEAASPEAEPEARVVFDEPDLGDPEPAPPPPPESVGEPGPEPVASRAPAPAIAEPAAAAATAEAEAQPKAGEEPAAAENEGASPRVGFGGAVAGTLGPVAERALGGVSRRLEGLSPTARQSISWVACMTALYAAAVWTVLVLRWSAPALPPKEADGPAGGAEQAQVDQPAAKSAKAAAKHGGGH